MKQLKFLIPIFAICLFLGTNNNDSVKFEVVQPWLSR